MLIFIFGGGDVEEMRHGKQIEWARKGGKGWHARTSQGDGELCNPQTRHEEIDGVVK